MSQADWLDKDFYKILGVSKSSGTSGDQEGVPQTGRGYTPTPTPTPRPRRFKAVMRAYDVVGDAEKRKEYDDSGASEPQGASAPAAAAAVVVEPAVRAGSTRPTSAISSGVRGRRPAVSRMSSQGCSTVAPAAVRRRGTAPGPARGHRVEVNISFTEALDGVTLPLRLSTEGACGTCHGTGARGDHSAGLSDL